MIPTARDGFSLWSCGYRLVGERDLTSDEREAFAKLIRDARWKVGIAVCSLLLLGVSPWLLRAAPYTASLSNDANRLLVLTAWIFLGIPAFGLLVANAWWLGPPQQDLDSGRACLLHWPPPFPFATSGQRDELISGCGSEPLTRLMLPNSRITFHPDSLEFLNRSSVQRCRLREVADPPEAWVRAALRALRQRSEIKDAPGYRFVFSGTRPLAPSELLELRQDWNSEVLRDAELGAVAVCLLLIRVGEEAWFVGDPDWEYYHDFNEDSPSEFPTRVVPIEILPHSRRIWTGGGVPASWRFGSGCWSGLRSFPDLLPLVQAHKAAPE